MLYKKLLSAYSFCIMMTQYAICVWLQVLLKQADLDNL